MEWIAFSYSRGSSKAEIEPESFTSLTSALASGFFITNATRKAQIVLLIPVFFLIIKLLVL